ncbi:MULTISPECIES: Chromate resistance protein ChrB [unclassified Cryobacterium]|uniref:Chromate resistance protein ChrB n=1 Tax=unclassified Cryobacterium TaxID=2649013 RepID=UPI001068E966|nr:MULTISPECIES: Chromate resistance protein ChrB [unclassified Cryobacterium]TFC51096.1 chromate resistance protein ChrB [Cryobacterium sp. TMB3-1-2]TFC74442.1 chromate resistance protein ChrB [Cryobacterium sp. TMB3-15]TFC79955.1 chromate resistance protein ChrB [Cryobacterium sp. TMB3-10]TFD41856.1 chromate resistance protein ChrB [Cryobacterium sp. TMB3-12]
MAEGYLHHRVAIWRELRRMGAVPATAGAWAVPNLLAFTEQVPAVRELAERGEGTLAVFEVTGQSQADASILRDAFAAARRDEWNEFIADCGKFDAEIDREFAKEKFTFGELEEEEQSLDRLRRWHRDLMRRDALALPDAVRAAEHLAQSTEKLAVYSERVFEVNLPADPSEG